MTVVLFVLGLGVLIVCAELLVRGAARPAATTGIAPLVIGLTVVAFGTGSPEIATALQASLKGQTDLELRNVVGSNLFNLLVVLGLAAAGVRGGLGVPATLVRFDLPVMMVAAVAWLPVLFLGYQIARWEGGLFLGYYVAYIAYLILAAPQNAALPVYSTALVRFVLPMTAITLLVLVGRTARQNRRRARQEKLLFTNEGAEPSIRLARSSFDLRGSEALL